MKNYFFKINFLWDTEIDSKEFIITVPVNVSIADIEKNGWLFKKLEFNSIMDFE